MSKGNATGSAGALACLALVLASGCGGAIRSHFSKKEFNYPFHAQRMARATDVSPLPGPGCKNDPTVAVFLEKALQRITAKNLEQAASVRCALADATAFVAPFVAISPQQGSEGEKLLAMRIECFFDRSPMPGFPTSAFTTQTLRTQEAEIALDGWIPFRVSADREVFGLWNIALFRITKEASFHGFVFRYDEREYERSRVEIDMLTTPPLATEQWWLCGTGGDAVGDFFDFSGQPIQAEYKPYRGHPDE